MRALNYRFDSFDQLSLRLEAGGDDQDLDIPPGNTFRDGEWVITHVEIGEHSTSIAACVCDRGEGLRLAFEGRDWERLWQFAQSEGPPTLPPPSLRGEVQSSLPADARVLIVDDDADLRRVVSALLAQSGYATSAVASAEEALDSLRTDLFDMVILDWNLPGMTGIDFCRRLRTEHRSRLPVLFLTAHSSEQDMVLAFEAGADDYVVKPFRVPELTARVVGLLRRAQMLPPSHRM